MSLFTVNTTQQHNTSPVTVAGDFLGAIFWGTTTMANEYTVSVDDSRFLTQRERVGGLFVAATVEWRDDMPYATATTIESVGVSDEAPRARDVEHALAEIEAKALRAREVSDAFVAMLLGSEN